MHGASGKLHGLLVEKTQLEAHYRRSGGAEHLTDGELEAMLKDAVH